MDASWVFSKAFELKCQIKDWLDTSVSSSEPTLLPQAPADVVLKFEEYKLELAKYKKENPPLFSQDW